jgi:hypothetical protein
VATEDIAKKVIVKGVHDIIPNYVAGGMDATEGTYVWNHTTRGCPEEEWEELYKGKLGILEGEVITLDRSAGQRAWLKLEKRSDHMGEKDAQYTPSTCVCGMGQASANTGHGQGARYASRRERTGKHETGMDLPERP